MKKLLFILLLVLPCVVQTQSIYDRYMTAKTIPKGFAVAVNTSGYAIIADSVTNTNFVGVSTSTYTGYETADIISRGVVTDTSRWRFTVGNLVYLGRQGMLQDDIAVGMPVGMAIGTSSVLLGYTTATAAKLDTSKAIVIEKYFNTSTSAEITPYAPLQYDQTINRWFARDTTASLSGISTGWTTYIIADTAGKATGTYNIGRMDTLTNIPGAPFEIYVSTATAASTDTVLIFGTAINDNIYNPKPTNLSNTAVMKDTLALVSGTHRQRFRLLFNSVDSIKIKTLAAGSDSMIFWYRSFYGVSMADSLETNIAGISIGKNWWYNEANPAADTTTVQSWGYMITKGLAKAYGYTDAKARYINKGDYLIVGASQKLMRPSGVYGTLTGFYTDSTAIVTMVNALKNYKLPEYKVGRAVTAVDSTAIKTTDKAIIWVDVTR